MKKNIVLLVMLLCSLAGSGFIDSSASSALVPSVQNPPVFKRDTPDSPHSSIEYWLLGDRQLVFLGDTTININRTIGYIGSVPPGGFIVGSSYLESGGNYYKANYNIGDWIEWNGIDQTPTSAGMKSVFYKLVTVPYFDEIQKSTATTTLNTFLNQSVTKQAVGATTLPLKNLRYLYNTLGYLYAGYAARNIGMTTDRSFSFLSQANLDWDSFKTNGGIYFSNNKEALYTTWLVDPTTLTNLGLFCEGGTDSNMRNFGYGYPTTNFDTSWAANGVTATWMTWNNTFSTGLNDKLYAFVLGCTYPQNKAIARIWAAPYGQFFGVTFDSLYNSITYDGGYKGVVFNSGDTTLVDKAGVPIDNSYVLDVQGIQNFTQSMGTSTAFLQPMVDFLTYIDVPTYNNNLLTLSEKNYLKHITATATRLSTLCSITQSDYQFNLALSAEATAVDVGLVMNIDNATKNSLNMYLVSQSDLTTTTASTATSALQIGGINPGLNEVNIHLAGLMSDKNKAICLSGSGLSPDSEIRMYIKTGLNLYSYIQSQQAAASSTFEFNGGDITEFTSTLTTSDMFLVLETFILNPTNSAQARLQVINLTEFAAKTNNKAYVLNLKIENPAPYSIATVTGLSANILSANSVDTSIYYASVKSMISLEELNYQLLMIPEKILNKISLLNVYYGFYMSAHVAAVTDFAYYGSGTFGDLPSYLKGLGYLNSTNIYVPVIDLSGNPVGVYGNFLNTGIFSYNSDAYNDIQQVALSSSSTPSDIVNIQLCFSGDDCVECSQGASPDTSKAITKGLSEQMNMLLFSVDKSDLKKGIVLNSKVLADGQTQIVLQQYLTKDEIKAAQATFEKELQAQATGAGETVTTQELDALAAESQYGVLGAGVIDLSNNNQNNTQSAITLRFIDGKNNSVTIPQNFLLGTQYVIVERNNVLTVQTKQSIEAAAKALAAKKEVKNVKKTAKIQAEPITAKAPNVSTLKKLTSIQGKNYIQFNNNLKVLGETITEAQASSLVLPLGQNHPASFNFNIGSRLGFMFFKNEWGASQLAPDVTKYLKKGNWATGISMVLLGVDSENNWMTDLTVAGNEPQSFYLIIYDTKTGNNIGEVAVPLTDATTALGFSDSNPWSNSIRIGGFNAAGLNPNYPFVVTITSDQNSVSIKNAVPPKTKVDSKQAAVTAAKVPAAKPFVKSAKSSKTKLASQALYDKAINYLNTMESTASASLKLKIAKTRKDLDSKFKKGTLSNDYIEREIGSLMI